MTCQNNRDTMMAYLDSYDEEQVELSRAIWRPVPTVRGTWRSFANSSR